MDTSEWLRTISEQYQVDIYCQIKGVALSSSSDATQTVLGWNHSYLPQLFVLCFFISAFALAVGRRGSRHQRCMRSLGSMYVSAERTSAPTVVRLAMTGDMQSSSSDRKCLSASTRSTHCADWDPLVRCCGYRETALRQVRI